MRFDARGHPHLRRSRTTKVHTVITGHEYTVLEACGPAHEITTLPYFVPANKLLVGEMQAHKKKGGKNGSSMDCYTASRQTAELLRQNGATRYRGKTGEPSPNQPTIGLSSYVLYL